jgi:hypothetical protein
MIKQITQKKRFGPRQDVRLADDDSVTVTIKRLLSESTFKFHLREFDPEPSRQKSIPRKPVAVSIVLGLLFLTGAVPALTEADPTQRAPYIVSAVLWGSLLLATVLYAWLTRTDIHVYFQRRTGQPVLTLYHNNPTQPSFGDFVTALHSRLRALNPQSTAGEEMKPPERDHPFSLN